jgi:hypothetical protein
MGRTVVLRHDLPDGSHHFDWLFEPEARGETPGDAEDPNEHVLIAWRLAQRPDISLGIDLPAERLAPHRRLYLEYEGPVSGGRGVVTRVAAGIAQISLNTTGVFEAFADVGGGAVRVLGQPASREAWILRVTAATGS